MTNYAKDYVLGFAFDLYGAVALIEKARPDWQQGRWNGIGGHREAGEAGPEAMAREFYEESGMVTTADKWRHVGRINKTGAYRCLVYTAQFPILRCHTVTDERVKVFPPAEQDALGGEGYPCLANIRPMIELCRMAPDREGIIPLWDLDYSDKHVR